MEGGMYAKVRLIGTILRSLKIEPFVFVYIVSSSLSDLTTLQLVQDKICLNKYNQTEDYCIEISKLKTSGGVTSAADTTKNQILADLAQFTIYTNLISSLPSFIFVLFIGSWTDNYIHGRKITLLLGSLGCSGQFALLLLNSIKFELDVHYILLAYIPNALAGGWACMWLVAFSYLANNSSERYRLTRFAGFDLTVSAAGPLGTYLGGILLGSGNFHTTGSIHNYGRVLATSLVGAVIGFFWVLITINENKGRNDENSNLINTIEEEDIVVEDIAHNSDNHDIEIEIRRPRTKIETKFRFSKVFDIKNLREVFRTAIKVRPNKGRAQVWLLYLSMCTLMMSSVKDFPILFPFVEEVYDWDAKEFSVIKSMASIVQITSTSVIVFTLSAYLKVGDTKLGIIGFVSVLFSSLCIGSILQPIGLYLMYLVGSASGVSSISIRSLLSKLASETESGKIFSLLAALETVVPLLNSAFYNTLFEYTIDFYPSLGFQIAGALMLLPIFIYIWIDLTRIPFN